MNCRYPFIPFMSFSGRTWPNRRRQRQRLWQSLDLNILVSRSRFLLYHSWLVFSTRNGISHNWRRFISVDLNHGVRAYNCTGGTAGTFVVVRLGREVAVLVGLLGDHNYLFGAYRNAEATALTPFGVNKYFTSHYFLLSVYVLFHIKCNLRCPSSKRGPHSYTAL